MSRKQEYDSFDVTFVPMVNVKAKVKDPEHLTEEEFDEIVRLAAQNLHENYDDVICGENVQSIRPYDSKTGTTGPEIQY